LNAHRWLREPLVHFLALGALLFLAFYWRGGGPGSNRIVITRGQIEAMASGFARTWQRPPTDVELKALIDDYVREEMATREAVAMGLDRDDTIIRRRLRQKLEFFVDDTADTLPVTDQDVRAWLDAHPDRFQVEPVVAFRQVFISEDRRGGAAEADARALLASLVRRGRSVDLTEVGDRIMLPSEVPASTRGEIARQFGEAFADGVMAVAPGEWTGPIRSGFGLHLVQVLDREEGRAPALDEVRPLVEREVRSERRKTLMDAMYDELLSRYRVRIDLEPDVSTAASGGFGGERR